MKHVFLTQPYLLTLHPDTEMNICWLQSIPEPGFVEFGRSHILPCRIKAEVFEIIGLRAPATEHGYSEIKEENPPMRLWQCIAHISGLNSAERIYYRCISGGTATRIFDFHTAVKPGAPFRFAQLSDLQGFQPCDDVVRLIGTMQPDFLLYSGDAAFYAWRADQWIDLDEPWQDVGARKRAFFPAMQQCGGARLMQYCPTFLCPGNHEVDDFRVGTDKQFSLEDSNWSWSIYMQIFRPLYPEGNYSLAGKRWYSVDYGDLHIVSLHISRWALWGAYEYPGWRLTDAIAPGSPQIRFLTEDLADTKRPFKWVIQHWHLFNKGTDVQNWLCPPAIDAKQNVTYPDDYGSELAEIYSRYGVNGVSYGHSHVYERYYYRGTHYIEAAYLGCCCREPDAPLHPMGVQPLVEDNSQQSFLIVDRCEDGLWGSGFYACKPDIPFDRYQIADAHGHTVAPPSV